MKKLSLFVVIIFLVPLINFAQVLSDFEVLDDTDGWQSEGDGNYYWEAGNGNPGGCFRVDDDATGDWNNAYAPVKFLGDWSSTTSADYLSTDVFLHIIGGNYTSGTFVFQISGPGGTAIAFPNPQPPQDIWTNYTAYLDPVNWNVTSGNWNDLIQHVSEVIVRAEYIQGDEYNRLDNISLSFSPVAVPLSPVVCSDFESGLFEGWSTISSGGASIPSSGGNPGKYFRVTDGTGISLAIPSSKFHGDWSLLDGHNAEILVDYKITNISGSLLPAYPLVKISGPGGEATYLWDNSIMNAYDNWYSFMIPIEQSGWTVINGSWAALLNYVTDIQLAAEFIDGSENVCIDNFCISDLPPSTDFIADKTFIFEGDEIQFTDQTTSVPQTWDWDFGDSGTSTDNNPFHIYANPGTYTVELTTANHFGSDTETKTDYIEVYPIDQCLKFEDDFDDNTIHPVWSFKNGTWSETSQRMRQSSNHYVNDDFLEGCFAIAGSLLWEDYIISCDFQSTDDDMIGFVFNYQDESNMYMFRWNKESPTGRTLSKYENGTETILASDYVPYVQNDWYHADIFTSSLGNIVLTINGTEIFSVSDNTFLGGKVGLYCWGNQSAYFDNFRIKCPGIPVELIVVLEGPYNSNDMNTDLNGNPELVEGLSLSNPYTIAPWNHPGTEAVLSFTNPDVVDWVLVDFRDATTAMDAVAATSIGTKAALLLNDGQVVSPYGGLPLYLNTSINNNFYVVIKHRNHLGILSANPLTEVVGKYSYDFTSGPTQAYGTDAQKNLGGVYGMFAGDADASGTINDDDKNIDWENESGSSGYIQSDLNLDGQANNLDKNDFWLPNYNESEILP